MPPSSLDPVVLARLANLQLRTRHIVEGVLTGLHKSRLQGQAVEFAEHKEYAPGDELRHIDWRAQARLDKYYVKNYELETNLRAWVLLDASASMGYGRQHAGQVPVTKLDYARMVAATLAYLLVRQQDFVGLVVAGSAAAEPAAALDLAPPPAPAGPDDDGRLPAGVRRCVPARASPTHFTGLVQALEELQPRGDTHLAGAVDFLAEKANRRAAVYVLSDLFDPSPDAVAALARLRARRCDVSVFHVLDPDELDFPFEDPTEFLSLEGPARIEAHPRAVRQGYLEEMREFIHRTRRALREVDVDYTLASTGEPPDRLLLDFLARRRRQSAGTRRG